MKTIIRQATVEDAKEVAGLAIQMWKSQTIEELAQEFCDSMKKGSSIIFLAISEECAVGFAQCGLRRDYVEGTDTSPVGYLEGIFVAEAYRKRGLAKDMLEACQKWAEEQGCTEFASDCELFNEDSLRFHLKMGFEEANRIICFTKKLNDSVIGETNKTLADLQPWECLMKRIVWKQLGNIKGERILDFGSGLGVTANHLAENNEVTAIEPDEECVSERWTDNPYTQIIGSTEELRKFPDETFDRILCHNVLEYATDREEIVTEFARILKADGKISIVKHNRAGRVMQMVVLLNDFAHAHRLLDGKDGMASKYGTIRYYEDCDIESWCPELKITKTLGMRTFWDMQQNQEIHKDAEWQDKMVEIEMRVSDMDEYKDIAFFHHLTIEKIVKNASGTWRKCDGNLC